MLPPNGIVAVQLPLFWDMPLGNVIDTIANETQWKDKTRGVSDLFIIHNHSFYYDVLSELFMAIEMWETHYMHVLDSHEAMIQMMRSTGLKPYLQRLNGAEKTAFEKAVLNGIKEAYPTQKNNKVLLPFKRLFFIARKQGVSVNERNVSNMP